MAVKRGKTFYAYFCLDGIRYRESLHTTDWREAERLEKDLIARAKQGKLAAKRVAMARLMFREAAEQFINDPGRDIKPLSRRTEKERSVAVNKALGHLRVRAITVEDVLEYVRERKSQGKANATINRELDIIRGVLKKAKRWHLFADEVKTLATTEQIGRALLPEEKIRLVRKAASKPEWQTAYYATILALNTTMRSCELKGLRWRDVDFLGASLTVMTSKTEAGERMIPLNRDALQVLRALYGRSRLIGGAGPDDYVFFGCENGRIDPTRPQKSWRTAWRNLREAAGLPKLRFHDLRHHAITELAESQASDSTIMAIAGHVSPKMLKRYSHVRVDARRKALDALSTGYATKDATNELRTGQVPPEVVENMVELVGIEPTTSSLRTMRSPS
jgi:integrase